ncbi:AraC family transcriptional regulator [Burkholderia multivorans]|uniref:AraC family transcriptional regulator n=1 Tax=Burkholderia multivorans TaxID=87883 RepID=A0ABD7LG71_9BURK|nr:helix-turn-helix domain-containing protein [Burkholderia multivorans]SAK15308.1 AraC family transcriptional regulator [Burkholderia multivorans]
MRHVLFVVPPRVHMLDLSGPLQVLNSLVELNLASLSLRLVGPQAQPASFQGVQLMGIEPLPPRLNVGDIVIVVGCKLDKRAYPNPQQLQVVEWLRSTAAPMRAHITLASVCTGAILLAEAGLLDGHNCTTHHDYLATLQQRHPRAKVLARRVLVDDNNVLTSAGVSAGIDLALHLVARYFGPAVAIRVARDNVVTFRRMDADPALDIRLQHRNHGDAVVHAVQDEMSAHPESNESYTALASRFGLSYRHLARLFQEACGITLKHYQQQLRLAMAERLLCDSNWPIERIAEHCGFASSQAFRAAWRQRQSMSPLTWRSAQRTSNAALAN